MDDSVVVALVVCFLFVSVLSLLVLFPPGFDSYRGMSGSSPPLQSVYIPPSVAHDLYDALGPAVLLRVHSDYGVSEQMFFLSPMGVTGSAPVGVVEPSTVFELSVSEYNHWCSRLSELSAGYYPKDIYLDAVVSFLFDVKVKPVWKKAGLVSLAFKHL